MSNQEIQMENPFYSFTAVQEEEQMLNNAEILILIIIE